METLGENYKTQREMGLSCKPKTRTVGWFQTEEFHQALNMGEVINLSYTYTHGQATISRHWNWNLRREQKVAGTEGCPRVGEEGQGI